MDCSVLSVAFQIFLVFKIVQNLLFFSHHCWLFLESLFVFLSLLGWKFVKAVSPSNGPGSTWRSRGFACDGYLTSGRLVVWMTTTDGD